MSRFVCSIIFALCLIPSTVVAEASPESTLQEIVTSLKQKGSISGLADYVHWETALQKFPAAQRTELGITTAQDLRKFYVDVQSNPGAMLRKQMQKQGLPPEQTAMMEQQIGQLTQFMQQEMNKQQEKLKRTDFQIGSAAVEGDVAKVPLTTTLDGKTQKETVTLQKFDGKWMLPGLQFVDKAKGPKKPMGAPMGGAPMVQ